MELDRITIKSLSSETRIDILKSLARRRKMPAELSKEFGMAASTISEHLKNLEQSRLIQKKETGHKWIYYELTEKGNTLVKPQYTPQFVVVLVLGGLIFLSGFSSFLSPYPGFQQLSIDDIGSPLVKNMEAAKIADTQNELDKGSTATLIRETNNSKENELNKGSSALSTDINTTNTLKTNNFDNIENNQTPKISLVTLIVILVGMWVMILAFALPKKYKINV